MSEILSQLKEKLPDVIIEENEPLAPFTSFRIGGPARYFLRARSTEMLKTAILAARTLKLPLLLLGGGCNVLVSDAGFPGLVIKVEDRHWQTDGELIRAGSGVPLLFLARETAAQGNMGFEFAAGILGTVGGAVRVNASSDGKALSDCVVRVEILDGATTRWLDKEECQFERHSSVFLAHSDWVILEVEFFLEFGSKEHAEAKVIEILQHRLARQASGMAGVRAFRALEHNGQWVSVGELIKEVGLNGHAIGGAAVLKEDPNYIVNTGRATADDVLQLMSLLKARVRDELGVQLQDAIDLVGF